MPLTNDTAATSLIEQYHQDSLDSGARIRAGLSHAVERAIRDFGNGFLACPNNDDLRAAVVNGGLSAGDYYQQLLRLIYRLLFLMVIEERDLVFPADAPRAPRDIHRKFYSVARPAPPRGATLPRRPAPRRISGSHCRPVSGCSRQTAPAPSSASRPWRAICSRLRPSARSPAAPSPTMCSSAACAPLGLYRHPDSGQIIRVNYAALNVEEVRLGL